MSSEVPRDASASAASRRNRRKPARERLLAAADRLLYTEGLGASGIDRIIREADIAKGSFYGNFPSKDALIDAYLEERHHRAMSVLHAIEASDANMSDKIDALFDYVDIQVSEDAFRGCAFVVAAAETSSTSRPPMRWARENRSAMHDSLVRMGRDSGVRGPTDLADQICILYDGALVNCALRPDSKASKVARQMAKTLLAASQA